MTYLADLAEIVWEYTVYLLNIGLYLGLAIGVILVLRPVTNRLLAPGQRLFLWGAVWLAGYLPQWMALLGWIPFPVSLRQLVTPRAMTGGVWANIPAYLPEIQEAGTYNLALPGGLAIPFQVSQGVADHLWLLAVAYWALVLIVVCRQGGRVKRLTRNSRALTSEDYNRLGLRSEAKVEIKLCPDLPTSFVLRGGAGHQIFLQQELPPEQMRLVLLHEREHVRQHHPWLQGLATVTWAFSFWNPLVWAGYYLFRRDMELACDRGVLNRLSGEERREYAHTLVELASDRPVWGGVTTFGECDASVRVKAATRWRPEDEADALELRRLLGWAVTVLLALFLTAGAPDDRALPADILLEMDRMGIWDRAAQELTWDEDTTFYAKGDGDFASVKFQGPDGTWQQIHYRRYESKRYGIEVHCGADVSAPDGDYVVLIPGGE